MNQRKINRRLGLGLAIATIALASCIGDAGRGQEVVLRNDTDALGVN